MASPVGDSYWCESGGIIAGGRSLWRDRTIVVAGDSLTDAGPSWGGGGYQWGLALARSPVVVAWNAGVAGNQIGGLTARWTSDVAAKSPAAVLTRIGTNDVSSGSTTDTTAFAAAYQPIIDWHVSTGIKGILHAIPPEDGTPGPAILARNSWLSAQCAAHPGLLRFVDDSMALGDGSYTANLSYIPDGTHMNGWGRYLQGVAMASGLAAVFGTADIRLADATDNTLSNPSSNQHVKNPHMAGTSGTKSAGITGTVPDYWDVTRSGSATGAASIVAADAEDPVQVPWLRVTPSAAAAGDEYRITTLLEHPAYDTTLASLTRLDLIAEVRFVGLDASKFTQLMSGCYDGPYWPSGYHWLHMGFPVTLNDTVIIRHALPRDNVFWSDVAHAANSLRAAFHLTVAASGFASSPGSIDIRCASVRGRID